MFDSDFCFLNDIINNVYRLCRIFLSNVRIIADLFKSIVLLPVQQVTGKNCTNRATMWKLASWRLASWKLARVKEPVDLIDPIPV